MEGSQGLLVTEDELRKARGLAPEVPRVEWEGRLHRAREAMRKRNIEALVVYGAAAPRPATIRYLTNYVHPNAFARSFLILPLSMPPVLLLDRAWNVSSAQGMSWIEDVRTIPSGRMETDFAGIRKSFREAMVGRVAPTGRVGLFLAEMPAIYHHALQAEFPHATFVDGSGVWTDLVARPSAYDADMIRKAAAVADLGMQAFLAGLGEGRPEYAVSLEAIGTMASLGGEFLRDGVCTHLKMGASSEVRSNVRPFLYTGRRLQRGDMFWIDFNACYRGYFCDFDRTACISPPSPEQQRIYGVVRLTYDELLKALKPGLSCQDLLRLIREIAAEHGYADNINHIGHGHVTGIDVTERPVVVPGEEGVVEQGMFFNIEPSIIVPGVGSASIEDMVWITATGGEPVTRTPLDLHIA